MNRSFYDKLCIVATAILLCVVVILTLTSSFKKKPESPAKPEDNVCKVLFYEDDNETLIRQVSVNKGEKASIDNPNKQPSQYNTYTFSNWTFSDGTDATQALQSVQADMTVFAKFEEKVRSYTITFYQTKTSKIPLLAPTVEAGGSYDPSAFTFEPPYDEDYDYVFDHWEDKDGNDMTDKFDNILNDLVVYASYQKNLKVFSLDFKSPYIMVKEGDGTFVGYQLANQVKLYKNSIITIQKTPPDGKDVIYEVDGATVVDKQAGTYKVYSDVEIRVALI